MLKSCSYCGRIHDSKHDCGKKPVCRKIRGKKDVFRSTAEWQRKAKEIKERDNYLCQICVRNMYETNRRLNSENLSVHHAIPLENNFEKRLDNDNLLTVCSKHHEMAESGKIPLQIIQKIIAEQKISPGDKGVLKHDVR